MNTERSEQMTKNEMVELCMDFLTVKKPEWPYDNLNAFFRKERKV